MRWLLVACASLMVGARPTVAQTAIVALGYAERDGTVRPSLVRTEDGWRGVVGEDVGVWQPGAWHLYGWPDDAPIQVLRDSVFAEIDGEAHILIAAPYTLRATEAPRLRSVGTLALPSFAFAHISSSPPPDLMERILSAIRDEQARQSAVQHEEGTCHLGLLETDRMDPAVEVWSVAETGGRRVHRVSVARTNRLPSIKECAGWRPHPVWVGWIVELGDGVELIPEFVGITDSPFEPKDRMIYHPLSGFELGGQVLLHGRTAGWGQGPTLYALDSQGIRPVPGSLRQR